MHIAASVHSAHQRQHTVYGTGSNLDRERTDVCEGGPKCSRYRYIFDYNDTRIVLSHQQKYFIYNSFNQNCTVDIDTSACLL